ncbi:hypothetical protein [Bremerella cremea]|uniref:hypothetical protein n=1 Tax=Bremerella cremea TaxID=1031537 RepID=UPI0031E7F1AD
MSLYWVFFGCAVVAGTIFVLQFLLAVVGIGLEGTDLPDEIPDDIPDDYTGDAHGSTALFGVISFKTLVTAFTFFGLAGLACLSAGLNEPVSFAIAVAFGIAAMYAVHWLMQVMLRLAQDGTVRIANSVGENGTVYIPIPPHQEGVGKIQIRVQDQIVEYAAQTTAETKLTTGTPVQVVEVLSPTIVLVVPLVTEVEVRPGSAQPEQPAQTT